MTFNPGVTSQSFNVPITYDDLVDGNKTVNLTLSSPSNGYLSNPSTATLTINFVAATGWTTTGQQRTSDPQQGLLLPYGPAHIGLQTGDLHLEQPLDFRQSVQTSLDDWSNPGGPPALVYNSDSVGGGPPGSGITFPIVESTFATDPTAPVPSQIQVQLTWNGGTPQSWVNFATTGHSAGDTYLLAVLAMPSGMPPTNPAPVTGRYPWTLEVKAHFTGRGDIDRHVSGMANVVVNGGSDPFGYGWTLAGLDRLQLLDGNVTVSDAAVQPPNFSGSSAVFTVFIDESSPQTKDVTVKYATADGTAVAGTDYTATFGTLTIPAGQQFEKGSGQVFCAAPEER